VPNLLAREIGHVMMNVHTDVIGGTATVVFDSVKRYLDLL